MSRMTREANRTRPLPRVWESRASDHVIKLAWCPTGRAIAAAPVTGPIRVHDASSGALRHELAGHRTGTTEVAFSPDGTHLSSGGQDGTVRVWDLASGTLVRELDAGAPWVARVCYGPARSDTGALLAVAAGRRVRFFDGAGALISEHAAHASTVTDVQWKPGEEVLASSCYGSLFLLRAGVANPLAEYAWKGSILTVRWSPDGNFIATGDQDSTVHFWFARTGKDLRMHGYPAKVRELAWDPESRYLATGGSHAVTVWDCAGKGPENTTPLQLEAHQDLLSALEYQARGPLLASGGLDGRVFVWQPARRRRALLAAELPHAISQLAWSADGRDLAAATVDGGLEIFRCGS